MQIKDFFLFTKKQFNQAKCADKLPVICMHCNRQYMNRKTYIQDQIRLKYTKIFCSRKCSTDSQKKRVECTCTNCNISFERRRAESNRPKHLFCSKSCASTYHNTHKTRGIHISKLEIWLQQKLREIYPDIVMHYNRKDAINSELDIFIPELKLAFELNGIFHYEPIYGEEKLKMSKNNDERKMQACFARGIELCVINTTAQKHFKESTSQKFLTIITTIVNKKIKGV